jgi:hypothetical protein
VFCLGTGRQSQTYPRAYGIGTGQGTMAGKRHHERATPVLEDGDARSAGTPAMEDDAQSGRRSAMPSLWQLFMAIHGCGRSADAAVPEMAAAVQHGAVFVTPELHVLSNAETCEGLQGPGAAEDGAATEISSSNMASMADLADVHTDLGMPTESVQQMLSPRPDVQPQAFGLSSCNMQYLSPKPMLLYSPPRDGHALLATSAWD